MRTLLLTTLTLLLASAFGAVATAQSNKQRPNILWLFAEDTSPWMGCYGHSVNVGATGFIYYNNDSTVQGNP